MSDIRIGYVKYLNTLPLVQGLHAWEQASMTAAVPSKLIDLLLSREIDIGLVSIIDAVRSSEAVVLVPCGMIGSDGPTMTVRLFSRVPLAEATTIHADTDSHTSTVLAQVVLDLAL